MYNNRKFLTALLLGASLTAGAQTFLKQEGWEMQVTSHGHIDRLVFKNKKGNDTIPFFHGEKSGPAFYMSLDDSCMVGKWTAAGMNTFSSEIEKVECILTYTAYKNQPAVKIRLTNKGPVPFQPQKAGIKLGIDTYMDKYPDWFGKYFPTLMRNEKTHFYGYMQTPGGHILGLVSEQPVASWSVDYNLGYMDPPPHWFMGHRIESLNLDLMNALPLPSHCPQDLWQLKPGESKTWILAFTNIGTDLEKLETGLRKAAGIPLVAMGKTSYLPDDEITFFVYGNRPSVTLMNEKGNRFPVIIEREEGEKYRVNTRLPRHGLYTLQVVDGDKQSEALLTVHAPWQWVMEEARKNVLRYHQKATSHAESWYGFYSAFIAARYFPDKKLDEAIASRFDYLFNLLHDTVKVEPLYYGSRIQNTATTIGMLVDKYEARQNIGDLQKAAKLADWLITNWQREDGAYCNHDVIYTSVIYIAKSVLELAEAEKKIPVPEWQEAAARHYLSAKKAIDQLVRSQGDFQTEGELTFEDGMISCSALQIGLFALLQTDPAERKYYTDKMLEILNSHDCLTQLKVPDSRRRQGTMRYWEAQYDVQMLPNMFNSPHGWSAWRAYATYYAYLLTGEEKWLRQTFNAMGAFSHLIDYQTGQLRWAFVIDPYLKVEQACSPDLTVTADSLSFGNPHPRLYQTRRFVIGEQYVDMVSDWQPVNTQDNDVHELFKCIGETVLTNAFILEKPDGSVEGYNCTVERNGNRLDVRASEKQIVNLHANLKHAFTVRFGNMEKLLPAGYRNWAFKINE